MGNLIETFEATGSGATSSFTIVTVLGIIFLLVCGGLLFTKSKKISYNYRLLFAMLAFFFGIIAIGQAYYKKLLTGDLGTVSVYEKGIQTPQKNLMLSQINDAYIYKDEQQSLVNPQKTIQSKKVLVIEYGEQQRLSLRDEYYPVEAIFSALKEAVKEKNKKK